MIEVTLAVLPVFLLIACGFVARRTWLQETSFWSLADKAVYYLFFPALLMRAIATADFASEGVVQGIAATALATLVLAALLLVTQRVRPLAPALFSSVFQGATRYNSYVFLALSAQLFGTAGVAISGIFIAWMIILTNVMSVAVLSHYGEPSSGKGLVPTLTALCRNPLIIAALAGLALNGSGLSLPTALFDFLGYLGGAATPLSLMSVGAGLMFAAGQGQGAATAWAVGLKLLGLPLLTYGALGVLGAGGTVAAISLLYAAMPCAGNAYILARQMGGDSQAMAAIITASTLVSAVTITLIMGL